MDRDAEVQPDILWSAIPQRRLGGGANNLSSREGMSGIMTQKLDPSVSLARAVKVEPLSIVVQFR